MSGLPDIPSQRPPASALPPIERGPQDRFEQAKQYLNRVGLQALTPGEHHQIKATYGQRLKEAIGGDTSHLKMVDTLIDPQRIAEMDFPPNKTVWVAEVGGTNLRVAILETDSDGEPHVVEVPSGRRGAGQPAFMSVKLDRRQFSSMDEFTTMVADRMHDLARLTAPNPSDPTQIKPPDVCGYIFSFSGTPVEHADNIDVMFTEANLPAIAAKGFAFPGIEAKPVGEALNDALRNHYDIDVPTYVTMNDTPILAISHPDSRLGLVVGTGANFSAIVDNKLYNTALPTFHEAPTYELFRKVDATGEASAFKEIGGMYLGKIMAQAIEDLYQEGILTTDLYLGKEITASDMATIVRGFTGEGGEERLHQTQQLFSTEIDAESQQILQEIARRLFARSAELMGTFLATFMNTFPDHFRDHEIIPAQGSVMWEAPEYEETLRTTVNGLLENGKTVEFSYHPHAGIVGITHAALSVLQAKQGKEAA